MLNISCIRSFLITKLGAEYHHLSLWYFVFFFYGIAVCFHYTDQLKYLKSCEDYLILWSILLLILLGLMILFRKQEKLFLTFICGIFLSFAFGGFVAAFRISNVSDQPIKAAEKLVIEAKIDSLKPTKAGLQLVLTNIDVLSRWQSKQDELNLNKIKINLRITEKESGKLEKGDRIRLPVQIFPLQSALLPNGYDFGLYAYLSGIQATGYGFGVQQVTKLSVIPGLAYVYEYIQRFRQLIYHELIRVLGAEEGNFVAAILIGETKAISKNLATNMRNSGIAHILSVSGLHLSLVAMIFFISSRFLLNCSNYLSYKVNIKALSGVISIIGSFGYLLLSGSNIAATRAFIMTFIVIVAVIFERSAYPLRSVMIAGLVILLFSPEYVMHPSFQLSFSAVLCLISGYEIYMHNQQIFGKSKGIFGSVKLYVFSNIYSSFLGSIVTGPFVIYHFYKFATYSILMNLIAVPVMSFFMMPLTIIWLILMPFSFSDLILKLLGFFVRIVEDSASYVVSLPLSVINTGYITESSMLIYSFGFFWICLWKTSWRYFGVVIIFISSIMMYFTPKPDFIYDHRIKAVGVKQADGLLKIYVKNKMSGFNKDYWLSWYGSDKQDSNVQLNSLRFRRNEFKSEPAERILIREHRRDLRNSVVSTLVNDAVSSLDRSFMDTSFVISGNKARPVVSLNYKRCHDGSDVQIIASKKLLCKDSNFIVQYEELVKSGVVLIFCDQAMCEAKFGRQPIWEWD